MIIKLIIFILVIIISPLLWNEALYFTGLIDKSSAPDNNAPVHFYVINLDRQPERFTKFELQANKYGINIERISATDGYTIIFADEKTHQVFSGADVKSGSKSFEAGHKYDVYCTSESYELKEKPEFVYNAFEYLPRALTIGEVGLDCSYRLLWKKIADAEDEQIAVIFEDDAILLEGFDQNFPQFIKALPAKWDIAYLDANVEPLRTHLLYSMRWRLHLPLLIVNNYFTKIHNETNVEGTYAYVVNKESAHKLIDAHSRDTSVPIDYTLARAIRKRELGAYIAKDKIASHDDSVESEISNMGRKEFGN